MLGMFVETLWAIAYLAVAFAVVPIGVLVHIRIVTARAVRHIERIKLLATGHLAEPSLVQDSSASSSAQPAPQSHVSCIDGPRGEESKNWSQ